MEIYTTIEMKESYVYIIGDIFALCPMTKLALGV